MTDTKFVKGPWIAKNFGPHWNNPDIDNWEIHWSVHGECVVDHVYGEHNAYLIASAPEMYEALRCLQNGEGLPPGKTIESILAKARGEQQ